MEHSDPSAAECLKTLLENQARRLRALAARIDDIDTRSRRAVNPLTWAGSARRAHDSIVHTFLTELGMARHSLELGAEESLRAVASLNSYVR